MCVPARPPPTHWSPPTPVQRASADEREELLSGEVAGLQRRCAEAEARQQEAAARIPEATQPLMRQLEAMQAAAAQEAGAWKEAERGLQERLRAAEAAAAAATEQGAVQARELAEARAQLEAATEQLAAARAELAVARAAAESEAQRRAAAEATTGHLRSDLASAQESLNTLEKVRVCLRRCCSCRSTLQGCCSAGDGGACGLACSPLRAPRRPCGGCHWAALLSHGSAAVACRHLSARRPHVPAGVCSAARVIAVARGLCAQQRAGEPGAARPLGPAVRAKGSTRPLPALQVAPDGTFFSAPHSTWSRN